MARSAGEPAIATRLAFPSIVRMAPLSHYDPRPAASARSHCDRDELVLGIESSCDETAAAVVRGGSEVLSNVVTSQMDLHADYGGVVPEIASRAHIERILPVVREALKRAAVDDPRRDLNAIAVGHRPGLIGSLLVGVAAAKALAWAWGKPLVGIDHILAHLHAVALDAPTSPLFPAIGLVVSGGHTSLFYLRSPLEVETLGKTIDDAVGEAYDKAATILGLGYPGGPEVDRRAARGDERAREFPVSRLEAGSLDFSFSGLKTALLYTVRGHPTGRGPTTAFERDASSLSEREIDDLCASFQKAAIDAVMLKVERAFDAFSGEAESARPRALIVGGGVSANSRLRAEARRFAAARGIDLRLPQLAYCLDNAAMIAGLAWHRLEAGLVDDLALCPSPAGTT